MNLRLWIALGASLWAACSSSPGGVSTDDDTTTGRRDGGSSTRDAGRTRDAGKGDDEVIVDSNGCGAIRKNAPVSKGEVDVIWLIDTSASMLDEFEKVQRNIASFMQSLETTNADTRAVMITGIDPALGSPLASDDARYRFVNSEVDSQMLYTVALASFGSYEDFLRPNAATHFVMVTDDNDIIPPAAFKSQMEAQLGHGFTLHAIASESVNGRPCANPICGGIPIPAVCGAAAVGAAYNTLATETGGEQISICTEDWTGVFDQLRSAVVAAVPLPCDYELGAVSNGKFEPTEVQVVYTPASGTEREFPKAKSKSSCSDQVGWHYDSESDPSTVELCPAACTLVRNGGSIDIAFGCQPQILL